MTQILIGIIVVLVFFIGFVGYKVGKFLSKFKAYK